MQLFRSELTYFTQAGFLFSIKAAVVLVLYTLVIPSWPRLTGTSLEVSNIWLLRISVVLLALGSLMMGLSWNVGVLVPGTLFQFLLNYKYSCTFLEC